MTILEQSGTTMDSISETELLTVREVLTRLRVSQSTLQRLVKSGTFPAPVQIARRTFWPRRVVDAWLQVPLQQAS